MASHQRSSHTALAPCSSPAYCSQAASLPRRKKRKKKKKKKKKSDTSSRAKCDAEAAQESVAASRQEPEAEAEMGAARVATAAAQTKIEAEAEVARADVEATRAVQAAAATAQVEKARPLLANQLEEARFEARASIAGQEVAEPTSSIIGTSTLSDEIRCKLSALDEQLMEVLDESVIRLVSSEWVLAQPVDFRMLRRQKLEALEHSGARSPLLNASEAVALIKRGDRSVGAMTYGWLTPDDPDPLGERIEVLRDAHTQLPHIKAFFWDFASLPQKPRSPEEEELFQKALSVMGDMYASAIGTIVLQLKEIPDAPAHLPRYNSRAYDDRGWCCFEDAVSDELLARLNTYRKMREKLSVLPAKKIVLERGHDPVCAPDAGQSVDHRFEMIQERIHSATFTGNGEKERVVRLYRKYAEHIVTTLQKVLTTAQWEEQLVEKMAPLPAFNLQPQQLLYTPGELVMLKDQSLGIVDSTGKNVKRALADGLVKLSFDACRQAVLPWHSRLSRAGTRACGEISIDSVGWSSSTSVRSIRRTSQQCFRKWCSQHCTRF